MTEPDQLQLGEPGERVYIEEMGRLLERDPHTIRQWIWEAQKVERLVGEVPDDPGLLPKELWPLREADWENERKRRIYWTGEQVPPLLAFARIKRARQGWHGARRSA